jgi:hypothetical protein
VSSQQGTDVEVHEEAQAPVVQLGDQSRQPPVSETKAAKFERLILWFSQPASQISGRIVGLFGLSLVVATLVLGLIHMLGTVDFVATMTAGTVLSIGGIWAITTDYIRAQRAAAGESSGGNS